MKAYEFLAIVAPDGKLELPGVEVLELPTSSIVRVIVLVESDEDEEPRPEEPESDRLEPAVQSFRQGWQDAITGEMLPLTHLWGNSDAD